MEQVHGKSRLQEGRHTPSLLSGHAPPRLSTLLHSLPESKTENVDLGLV